MKDVSTAAVEVEETAFDWLRDLLGVPPEYAGFSFDGGSISNLHALIAARHRALGEEVRQGGLSGLARTPVMCSSEFLVLGRPARGLKLMTVLRLLGADGLRSRVREHCRLAGILGDMIASHTDFELINEVKLGTVCFRFCAGGQMR